MGSTSVWAETSSLACPLGTIVNNTMTFTSATDFTIVHAKGTDANFAAYTPWRVYTANTVTFTGNENVATITSIVITAGSTTYATAAVSGDLTVVTGTGSVSGSSSGSTATITMTGEVKEFRLKPSAQTRWSNIVINYTLVSSCEPANLTFAAPTVTKSVTDAPFVITANSDNGTTAITYSSLDTDVATVNAATGEVTIVGAGTTKIKANQAAGTHSGTDYCAGSAEYELTVAPLAAPVATEATNAWKNRFFANWNAVTGATSYELNVYTKEGGGTTTETEGFDGVIPNGNLISSATYLAGWSASSQSGSRQIYTTTGNYGVSSPSFAFTATGDYIETATYGSPITEFKFWAKQQGGATSSTLIQGYNGTSWTTIATLSNADVATTAEGTNAVYDLTALGHTDIVKIKMTFTKALGNLSIDDVSVTYGGEISTPITGSPFAVSGGGTNTYEVTGLTPMVQYYYTVKAKNGSFESAASNEVSAMIDMGTGVNNTAALSGISVQNGNLKVSATAGTLIEVYNIAGQKIVSQTAKEGVNTIAIAQRGAMIVKIGTETVKVVF